MITLGVNTTFHASAATLVVDGEVVAASEEERFTRTKHSKRPLPFTACEMPYHAINDCMREAGVHLADIDHLAYSFDPQYMEEAARKDLQPNLIHGPSTETHQGWDESWGPLFVRNIVRAPRQLLEGVPSDLRARFKIGRHDNAYRIHYVDHQLSHQASAFLASPFEQCAVMTLSGRGEITSSTFGLYSNDRYESLGEDRVPHSLGLLYNQVTAYLGFVNSPDENKVMVLAAMGERRRFRDLLAEHVRWLSESQYEILPLDLGTLFGPARQLGAPFEQHHFDVAAALQEILEETVIEIASWLRTVTGQPRLAMAGGVALNCVVNTRLRDSEIYERVWVQPASGDAGTALGAALWVDACLRGHPAGPIAPRSLECDTHVELAERRWVMTNAYLGPAYSDEEIEQLLRWAKLSYMRLHDVAASTSRLLMEGKLVGWFQGRMEFGPRALGARSILASPLHAATQTRINELKDREYFRQAASALPEERLAEWFSPAEPFSDKSPFILFTYQVLPFQAARIPAVCHQDGTACVQTVSAHHNPRFHALLERFGEITGVPILINTSFKATRGPLVCTPQDAIESFHSTPLDALIIGSFLLEKQSSDPD